MREASPTEAGFSEIVSDDFPVFHATIMRIYDSAGNVIETSKCIGKIVQTRNVRVLIDCSDPGLENLLPLVEHKISKPTN